MPETPENLRPVPSGADSTTSDALRASLERMLAEAATAGAEPLPPPVPDHTLLRCVGSGAYGEVWLARNALGTLRAVKVVHRARFKEDRPYEREFHGILKYEPISRSHEGLVQVLHVGRGEGCFYYVMELADDAVAGSEGVRKRESEQDSAPTSPLPHSPAPDSYAPRTLRSELASRPRLPPVEAAQFALRLAGALAHLHAHGLVHRDIKPSNVIFVGGHPKLADIGLVTDVGSSHSFVGTEGFIPPEGPGTQQADLFALGKLLYELATGRDRMDFPQLPPDVTKSPDGEALLELNEVMTRACTPEPKRRYATATEMQAELNLFLAGRSLRHSRTIERALARLKRFAAAACLFLALAVAAIWFVKNEENHANERARQATERARAEAELRQRAEGAEREQSRLRQEAQQAQAGEARLRLQAETDELSARRKAYAVSMNLVQKALQEDNLGRATELLNQQRPQPGQEDLRGWEWRYLWQFCRSDARSIVCTRPRPTTSVSFSRDGALLAVATEVGEITVWNVATGALVHQGQNKCGCHARAVFSPDTDLLAYPDRPDADVLLWNSRTGAEASRLHFGKWFHELAFVTGNRLVSVRARPANTVTVWDAATGLAETNFALPFHEAGIGTRFAISADGNVIAHAVSNQLVRVVERGRVEGEGDWVFQAADELTTAFALSGDGRYLATGAGYAESTVKLWAVRERLLIGILEGHRSWIGDLKFFADGQTLASASADQTIRLWNVVDRKPLRTLRGHRSEVRVLDVSRDGRLLASGSKDGSVLLWDLGASAGRPPAWHTLSPLDKPGSTLGVAFSHDSRIMAAAENNSVKLYDSATLLLVRELEPGLTSLSPRLLFSPDSRLLVGADRRGHVGVWDVESGRLATNFAAHARSAGLLGSAFRRGGRSVLTWGADNYAREWDSTDWRQVSEWSLEHRKVPVPFLSSASAPDGRLAFSADYDPLQVLSPDEPEERRRLERPLSLIDLAFSPDGNLIAGACEDGALALWDLRTTSTNAVLIRSVILGVHSVAFSPDGKRIAGGSNSREAIKLWDAQSREEVATLEGTGSVFRGAIFSPDGNTIAARNWNGKLHVWRAPSFAEIEAAKKSRALTTP